MKKIIRLAAGLLLSATLLSGCAIPTPPDGETVVTPPYNSSYPTGEQNTQSPSVTDDTTLESTEVTKPPKELFHYTGKFETEPTDNTDKLSLWVIWEAVSYDGLTAEITVKVGITCFNLRAPKSSGEVVLNSKTKSFSTKAIEYRMNERENFLFEKDLTFSVELDPNKPTDFDLSASWDYKDELLTVEGVITLPPDPESTSSITERIAEPEPQLVPEEP